MHNKQRAVPKLCLLCVTNEDIFRSMAYILDRSVGSRCQPPMLLEVTVVATGANNLASKL